MPEVLASPRQVSIPCQCFQTQKYCQIFVVVNPGLSRTVLRSFAHFFVLVFRLHKGLETLVLASCWRYHDRVLACAGCLSQTAGLELCSFANCVCSAAWVRLSLGTASKPRKVPRKSAVFAACWYGGLFTRPGVRLQKAAGGETGRWWFGASRSKSSKGPQAPKDGLERL